MIMAVWRVSVVRSQYSQWGGMDRSCARGRLHLCKACGRVSGVMRQPEKEMLIRLACRGVVVLCSNLLTTKLRNASNLPQMRDGRVIVIRFQPYKR